MGTSEAQSEDIAEINNPQKKDLVRLRSHWRFSQSSQEEMSAYDEIRDFVSKREHSTVLYPGALFDIQFPLLLTDADTFIFIDPLYASHNGEYKKTLTDTVKEISDDVETVATEEYEEVTFVFNGKKRHIHLYPQDAGKFTPKELKDRPSDILFLKCAPSNGQDAMDLYSPEALKTLISEIKNQGIIIEFGSRAAKSKIIEREGFITSFSYGRADVDNPHREDKVSLLEKK